MGALMMEVYGASPNVSTTSCRGKACCDEFIPPDKTYVRGVCYCGYDNCLAEAQGCIDGDQLNSNCVWPAIQASGCTDYDCLEALKNGGPPMSTIWDCAN